MWLTNSASNIQLSEDCHYDVAADASWLYTQQSRLPFSFFPLNLTIYTVECVLSVLHWLHKMDFSEF